MCFFDNAVEVKNFNLSDLCIIMRSDKTIKTSKTTLCTYIVVGKQVNGSKVAG